MKVQSAFILTFGLAVAGLVAAGAADAFSRRRLAVLAACAGLIGAGAVGLWSFTVERGLAFGTFNFGQVFSGVTGLVLLLAGLSLAGASRELSERGGGASTAVLVTISAVGAALAACATDLLMLLLALETSAITAYALVAMARTRSSSEGAMKYLIQGSISTAMFVLGIAIVSGLVSPTAGYRQVAEAVQSGAAQPALAGALLLLLALAFKTSAAPVHAWAPDAYSTAPAESAAYMSGALKLGALMALVVVFGALLPAGMSADSPAGALAGDLVPVMVAIATLSIAVGSLGALRQRGYTRMLAYAGVAQVGYALLAVVSYNGLAAILQGAAYAVATTGAFLAAVAFRRLRPEWDGSIEGLAGLGRTNAVVGAAVTLLMASLAGIPPLVGFWGKFGALFAVVGAAQGWQAVGVPMFGVLMWVALAIAVIGAVVALAYYGSVMRALFFGDATESGEGEPSPRTGGVVVVIAVLTVVLGLLPFVLDRAALGFA